MLTWGSKFLFGLSAAAVLSAIAYGLVTGGDPVGVISSGYKGGVGDHVGYTILLAAALSAFVLGCVAVVTRDGDAEAMALRAGVAEVPAVTPPAAGSFWGVVAAFGIACLVFGGVYSIAFVALGLLVLFIAALQWLILAWSDRATGDPAVNALIRSRVTGPFEVPIWSLAAFGAVAVAMSRVFLSLSHTGATVAGSIITLIIFGGAIVLSKIEVPRAVLSGIVALGAVGVLAAGIVAAAVGPYNHHGDHHGDDHGDEEHSAVLLEGE